MDDDDKTGRAREALSPFLAAALRARSPAELSSAEDRVSIDVAAADVRRALTIYEKDLAGDRLVDWIAAGRAARASHAAAEDHVARTAFRLEIAPPNGGAPESYDCATLDEVRERVDAAAASSVEAMRAFLGADTAPPEQLAAQLGRQAFRRLTSQIETQEGPVRFDLPDRPWLRLEVTSK
jgi:hypothetical protein